MRVQGAVIREQGQTFAVVIVKPHVVQNRTMAADTIRKFTPVFGVPIVRPISSMLTVPRLEMPK